MRYLLLILMLCVPAFGADTIYYVWPDAAGTGDGSSWTNAYTSLQAADDARDADISGGTPGDDIVFECKVTTTKDTAAYICNGWTTDADNTIIIQSTDRSYHLQVSNGDVVSTVEDYITFKGITFETPAIDGDGDDCANVGGVTPTTNLIRFEGCTFIGANNSSYDNRAFYASDVDLNIQFWNCIAYNFDGTGDRTSNCVFFFDNSASVVMHNCTAVGGKYGIRVDLGTAVLQNVVALSSLTADFYDNGATTTQIHCASQDATGDDFDTATDGNIVNQTLTAFTATYRLAAGNPCINAGTDLSGATPAVTTGIDGTARPQGASYDIGADEFVGNGLLLMRRNRMWR